ncbi:MAG TPA: hypothetical protein DDX71_06660 [Ruminococcus sp.]|nr:hypothetical protein [Ruminococcus sp.]
MMRLRTVIGMLLCCGMLTGCGTSAAPAAAPAAQPVPLPAGDPVDLSFFRETIPQKEETVPPVSDRYNSQITAKDGTVLAELTGGEWKRTEDGDKYAALLDTVTPDAVVGPDINNTLRLDTVKTDKVSALMAENGFEGCVIACDAKGGADIICNYPADKDYASAPNFNGSTAKILVSTAILDHGAEQLYADPGSYNPGGHVYLNWDGPYAQPVNRTLMNAFQESSNAYFMHAACELLHHKKMGETYDRYFGYNCFGSAALGYYFPADWMQIPQPDWNSILGDDFELGKSAIGLSDQVKITPLYLNAVTGAVAAGGIYELELRAESEPHRLEQTEDLPENIRSDLWKMMYECGQWTSREQFSDMNGYRFHVKTGTADTRYGAHNEHYLKRLLITGFVEKESEPVCVITVYCHNGAETGLSSGGLAPLYRQVAAIMLEE